MRGIMTKMYGKLITGLIKDVKRTTQMTGANMTIVGRDWRYRKDVMRSIIIGLAWGTNTGR